MDRSAAFTTLAAALLPLGLLSACSAPADQPGGITADEAQQLNDAAAMLDANSVGADALARDNTIGTP